jgi:hypothetical protein
MLERSARSGLVNRPLNRTNLRKLVRDMRNGMFITTTEPLKFNKKGGIINGQHRLNAIVESGEGQWFRVERGVPDEQLIVLDNGYRRTLADAEYILQAGGVRHELLRLRFAVSNAMARGMRGANATSDQEKRAFYNKHLEALVWVMEQAGGAATQTRSIGIRLPTTLLAPVARAYYTVDRVQLERFVALLRNPTLGTGEGVITLLRDYILQNTTLGWAQRDLLYRLTETAIMAFLQRREPKRLRPADKELFPLPEEEELQTAAD